ASDENAGIKTPSTQPALVTDRLARNGSALLARTTRSPGAISPGASVGPTRNIVTVGRRAPLVPTWC
ncbi:MAG: hypothetical protein U0835_10190, partial [Isosphaeraceae bacterium]